MLDTDWSDSWRGAFRIELRAEAIGLAGRGWPVLPGTYPAVPESATDQTGADPEWQTPAPAHQNWRDEVGAHPHRVAAWWTEAPYSLLVATGTVVDAVEVDDELGRRAACLLRALGQPAPIVAMPNGRWLFLTAASTTGCPAELAGRESVRYHGEGSWIPLPPTPFRHGVVHWRVKPEVWGWRLPDAAVVHDVLSRALEGARVQLAVAEPSAA